MNMTEQDWEIYLAEHTCSVDHMAEATRIRAEPQPVKQSGQDQVFDYVRIEKQTPKAKFFVTHETMSEIHGFWCPKAAIVVNEGKTVKVAHWCKIKIIQFI